jgi:hypothetical protein
MNSEFYINLKRVGYSFSEHPTGLKLAEKGYNKLIERLNKYALKQPDALKQFAKLAFTQISKEQKRISEIYESYKDKNGTNKFYYKQILEYCDDSKAVLLEYLAAYFPEMFENNPKAKNELRELLPFSGIAKSVLREKQPTPDKNKDHTVLLNKLVASGYIISEKDPDKFNNAINGGPLPAKKENRIMWSTEKKGKTEAARFCKVLGMERRLWNDHFVFKDGSRLNKTIGDPKPTGKINEILNMLGYKGAEEEVPKKIKPFR